MASSLAKIIFNHKVTVLRCSRILNQGNSRWSEKFMSTNTNGSNRNGSNRSNRNRSGSFWLYTVLPMISVGTAISGFVAYRKIQTHHAGSRRKQKIDDKEDSIETHNETKLTNEDDNIGVDQNNLSKEERKLDLAAAIAVSEDLCSRVKDEMGSPGLSVAVLVNGREIWSEGFGYADLENRVPCRPDSVMRIASISKSIAMTIVAKLCEEKKLDLDKDVREYVPEWPEKTYNGEKVTITTRQLVSHLSGVRHYDKACGKKKIEKSSDSTEKNKGTNSSSRAAPTVPDSVYKEFYSKEEYDSVMSAMEVFKDDELCSKPGTSYLYTTHGWTLVSAVAERAANKKFSVLVQQLFHDLGMDQSFLDQHKPIIYNRARQYIKNSTGRVINAPYVDCSNKYAGGGMLSSARDVARFGNAMLYSYQHTENDYSSRPGYLKPSTIRQLWSPVAMTTCGWDRDATYGMGWSVAPSSNDRKRGGCREIREYYGHTGAAVGGSSALIVMPTSGCKTVPGGVVVAMIANTSSVGMNKTAIKIAKIFDAVENV